MSDDMDENRAISQRLERLDIKLNELVEQAEKSQKEHERRLRIYAKEYKKKRRIRDTVAILSVLVALFGLWINKRDEIQLLETQEIQEDIKAVEKSKEQLIKAITSSRVLVINQIIDCPIQDQRKLKELEKQRNWSLVNIISINSGLRKEIAEKTTPIMQAYDDLVYQIENICLVNKAEFDQKTFLIEKQISNIFKDYLEGEYNKINQIQKNRILGD